MKKGLFLSKVMIEKNDSSYYSLSHQYGECSKTTEARRTSEEEVLHKQSGLPSGLRKGNMCKTSSEKYVHSKGEMKKFPTNNIGK